MSFAEKRLFRFKPHSNQRNLKINPCKPIGVLFIFMIKNYVEKSLTSSKQMSKCEKLPVIYLNRLWTKFFI